jgi:hypothetical protein
MKPRWISEEKLIVSPILAYTHVSYRWPFGDYAISTIEVFDNAFVTQVAKCDRKSGIVLNWKNPFYHAEYRSKEEALLGHSHVLKLVRAGQLKRKPEL